MLKDGTKNSILFSCETQKRFANEQIVAEHSLGFIISGKLELQFANQKIAAEAGNIALIRKNELVKALKIPDENGLPFKSINIFLTQEILRTYMIENKIDTQEKYIGSPAVDLSENIFLKTYFESLMPYLDAPDKFSVQMEKIKTLEAVEILSAVSGTMKQLLFNLNEPHKIDLEKFMNQNFMFNVSMSEFARLSGCSLSTFKRDFKKTFDSTPEKWLHNRRLDEAKYFLAEKKLKPVYVYYAVGFENFSHFSDAFKQRFGYNAKEISNALAQSLNVEKINNYH